MKEVAYLGPEGTNSQLALSKYDPEAVGVPFQEIGDVVEAVIQGKASRGIIPIYNSIDLRIGNTYKALLQHSGDINIFDAMLLDIVHSAGVNPDHGEIDTYYTIPTVFSQCSDYFKDMDVTKEKTSSTAAAMQIVARNQRPNEAAIGNKEAFSLYGLEALAGADDIGNPGVNRTRFFVIGDYESEPTGRDMTSVVVKPRRDRIGLLDDILSVVRAYNFNLEELQSMPVKGRADAFYMQMLSHHSEERFKECMAKIKEKLQDPEINVLGSYPHTPFEEPTIKTVGVIGGTGEMGELLIPMYKSFGYKVLVGSRDPNKREEENVVSYHECIANSDAIVVNVPIQHAPDTVKKVILIMKDLQRQRKLGPKLLVDETGVKSKVVQTMLESIALFEPSLDEVEVSSIHYMCGNKVEGIGGQNMVSITTERSGPMAQEFEDMHYAYGANITHTTPEEHDGRVVLTQGLEHAISVARQCTIIELAGHPSNLDPFSTPNSRASHVTDARISSKEQNQDLFSTMLEENETALPALDNFIENMQQIRQGVADKDHTLGEHMSHVQQELGEEYIQDQTEKSKKVEDTIKD